MALRTVVQSGNWSNPATWNTGVPVNLDTWIIPVGFVVTFDVDQTAFTNGLGAGTISGELNVSTAPGAYVMKIAGKVTVSLGGKFYIGSEETPLPLTTTFKLSINGNYWVEGYYNSDDWPVPPRTPEIAWYGQAPTNMYCRLASNSIIGQTVIPVDTDLTGDPLWKIGATVAVCNIDKSKNTDAQIHTIANVSATELTLSSGLTVAKLAESVIVLSNRNISVVGTNATTARGTYSAQMSVMSGVEFRNLQYGVHYNDQARVAGCSFVSLSNGSYYSYQTEYQDCAFAKCTTGMSGNSEASNPVANICMAGCATGIFDTWYYRMEDCLFSGCSTALSTMKSCHFSNCVMEGSYNHGIRSSIACVISNCLFRKNAYPFYQGGGCFVYDCEFSEGDWGVLYASGSDFYRCNFHDNLRSDLSFPGDMAVRLFGCFLNSTVQKYSYIDEGYEPLLTHVPENTVAYDLGGVPGVIKAWTHGGRVFPDALLYPAGFSHSHKFVHETTYGPVWLDFPVLLGDNTPNRFTVYLRRDTDVMTSNPKVQIIDPASDPMFGGVALAEFPMTVGINEWETLNIVYESARLIPHAILRVTAQNSSGNTWMQIEDYTYSLTKVPVEVLATITNDNIAVVIEDD